MSLRRTVLTGTAGLVMVVAATAIAGCGSQSASSLSSSPSATSGSSGSNGAAASSSSASASSSAAAPTGHASSAAVNPNVAVRRAARVRHQGPEGDCRRRAGRGRVGLPGHRLHQHRDRLVLAVRVPGHRARGRVAGHPDRGGGVAVAAGRACAGHPEAGRRREHAAADHPGAELPDVEVQPYGVDVPADLPAEPDHADLPGVQVNGMFGHGGEPADGERGAVRGWQRELRLFASAPCASPSARIKIQFPKFAMILPGVRLSARDHDHEGFGSPGQPQVFVIMGDAGNGAVWRPGAAAAGWLIRRLGGRRGGRGSSRGSRPGWGGSCRRRTCRSTAG